MGFGGNQSGGILAEASGKATRKRDIRGGFVILDRGSRGEKGGEQPVQSVIEGEQLEFRKKGNTKRIIGMKNGETKGGGGAWPPRSLKLVRK